MGSLIKVLMASPGSPVVFLECLKKKYPLDGLLHPAEQKDFRLKKD
jgi:hypothetical protein